MVSGMAFIADHFRNRITYHFLFRFLFPSPTRSLHPSSPPASQGSSEEPGPLTSGQNLTNTRAYITPITEPYPRGQTRNNLLSVLWKTIGKFSKRPNS